MAMQLTNHARVRMQQRSMRGEDIALIEIYGTPVRGGYLLRRKDVNKEVALLKKRIHRLERLENRAIIVENNCLITTYPASKSTQKKMLSRRNGR